MYTIPRVDVITKMFIPTFSREQASLLANVIVEEYTNLVKTSDFNELKEIVRDVGEQQKELVEIQKRTENRLDNVEASIAKIAESHQQLVEMRKRSEERTDTLEAALMQLIKSNERLEGGQEAIRQEVGEVSNRTERLEEGQETLRQEVGEVSNKVERLEEGQEALRQEVGEVSSRTERLEEGQEAMRQELGEVSNRTERLEYGQKAMRQELGGITKTMAYALENEAYRLLPPYLERTYNIQIKEPILRKYIGETEINIFGEGTRDGEPIVLVGESKSKLSTNDLGQLWNHMELVQDAQDRGEIDPGEIVPVFVTHMAREQATKRAKRENIIIVHSFEW